MRYKLAFSIFILPGVVGGCIFGGFEWWKWVSADPFFRGVVNAQQSSGSHLADFLFSMFSAFSWCFQAAFLLFVPVVCAACGGAICFLLFGWIVNRFD
jgi:hypothetical protein